MTIEYIFIAGTNAKDESKIKGNLAKFLGKKPKTILKFITVTKEPTTYKKNVIEKQIASSVKEIIKKQPDRIRVIYVPHEGSDILKKIFFPFADIQSINETNNGGDYQTNSKNNNKTEELSNKLIAVIKKGLKINLLKRTSCLLLPIKNFKMKKGFYNFLYEAYFGNFDAKKFSSEFEKVCGVKKAPKNLKDLKSYTDSRGLLFPVTKMSEGKLTSTNAEENPIHYLKGIYRLGIRWNAGFHFDVQHTTKPIINEYKFTCSLNGEVSNSKATHINIYLNDFVRVKNS